MHDTLVIQSHRSPLPYPWIESCLASVRGWCSMHGYGYRFMGDELFDSVPTHLLKKTEGQRVIATDLARLLVLQDVLDSGYETVIWLDADFLIFNPLKFELPDHPYAVGREVWIQHDRRGKLKVYKKVHNAFLMFRKQNGFLDFYRETAERLLSLNQGTMPPQFIGPKLLTALHNVAVLPVMESAGMLSPMVIKDIVRGEGAALNRFIKHSPEPIAAANLCLSSCDSNEVSDREIELLIKSLLTQPVWS
ncbi:MAG: hypothetical protein GQ470_06005 [Gammaproteobacteria bacterium]|nr:hypothetical protein [Gammaproteobacteria bacterium]